jgi:hypothetical protein
MPCISDAEVQTARRWRQRLDRQKKAICQRCHQAVIAWARTAARRAADHHGVVADRHQHPTTAGAKRAAGSSMSAVGSSVLLLPTVSSSPSTAGGSAAARGTRSQWQRQHPCCARNACFRQVATWTQITGERCVWLGGGHVLGERERGGEVVPAHNGEAWQAPRGYGAT